MSGLESLLREYEKKRYPLARRFDVQGEGPNTARDRVLHWLQSRAHESPGEEFLVIVERGVAPGRQPGQVEQEIRRLFDSLRGGLLAWWEPFTPGSLAIRISDDPRMIGTRPPVVRERPADDSKPVINIDVPPDLLPFAREVAQLRLDREELSPRLAEVVLGEVWVEAQAAAMENRISFAAALEKIRQVELDLLYED